MNRNEELVGRELVDIFALKLQELRADKQIDNEWPLIRIAYQKEIANSPFRFDPVYAKLHCASCDAIPQDSRSALYAVWEVGPDDLNFACPKCRPTPEKNRTMKQDLTSDILFGFLSILDQFGAILSERGREYRTSEKGREMEKTIGDFISKLDQRQKDTLDAIALVLDDLIKCINSYNENSNGRHAEKNRDVTHVNLSG